MSEITPERIAELRNMIHRYGEQRGSLDLWFHHANLISGAVNALPDLLDEIEQLRHALEVSQEMTDRLVDVGEKKDAEIEELRRSRTKLDCRYTIGDVADVDGRHCPIDSPCDRCKSEDEIERLRHALEVSQEMVDRLVDVGEEKDAEIEKLKNRVKSISSSLNHHVYTECGKLNAKIAELRAMLPKAFDAGGCSGTGACGTPAA